MSWLFQHANSCFCYYAFIWTLFHFLCNLEFSVTEVYDDALVLVDTLHPAHWFSQTLVHPGLDFSCPQVASAASFDSHLLWPSRGVLNLVKSCFWYLCGTGHHTPVMPGFRWFILSRSSEMAFHLPQPALWFQRKGCFIGRDTCMNICWMVPI